MKRGVDIEYHPAPVLAYARRAPGLKPARTRDEGDGEHGFIAGVGPFTAPR
jgi:hypothetical protein